MCSNAIAIVWQNKQPCPPIPKTISFYRKKQHQTPGPRLGFPDSFGHKLSTHRRCDDQWTQIGLGFRLGANLHEAIDPANPERENSTSLETEATSMMIWLFPKMVVPPKWMVKIMENPIKNGWFGGTKTPPIFGSTKPPFQVLPFLPPLATEKSLVLHRWQLSFQLDHLEFNTAIMGNLDVFDFLSALTTFRKHVSSFMPSWRRIA